MPPRAAGPEERLAPNEELVAGRRPVEEAFVARRGALRLLVVPQRRQALERIVLHATNLRIPIVEVEGGTLTALAGFDGHQGVGLVVRPRSWATIDDVLARAAERGEPPFVLVLDSLEDPQNFGTLLRSAEAAGVHGVIFPTRHQAPLSPAAVKASAGATEHLLLVPVDDLAASLADLHVRGLRVAGSEAAAPLTARQADLRGPLALVVGSEGQGLGPAIRRRCDLLLRIPMRGAIGSLNASVAGSILLFEALEQRGLPVVTAEAVAALPSVEAAESGQPPESVAVPESVTAPESMAGPEPGPAPESTTVPESAALDAGATAEPARPEAESAAPKPGAASPEAEPSSLGTSTRRRAKAAERGSSAGAEPAAAESAMQPARRPSPVARRRPKAEAGQPSPDAPGPEDHSTDAELETASGPHSDLLPGAAAARRRREPRP